MAHNLEIIDGKAAFVSARVDAWHKLGTVLPNAFTAQEALEHSMLAGWNIRKAPLAAVLPDGSTVDVPTRFATIRDNPLLGTVDVLGPAVSENYKIIQNEELVGLLDTLVDEAGASFETAGSLDSGRKVFVSMKLPGHIKVGGVDPVDMYLAAMTSHDGSMPTTLMVTPVRIVCQNTMNLAFKDNSHQFRIRHTSRADHRVVQQARAALEFSYEYLDGFQQEAEQLINTTMDQMKFEEIVQGAFSAPAGAPKSTVSRADNRIDELVSLFADADTHEAVRGTAWAGLNALTEWYDHFSPVRGAAESGAARAQKALLDTRFKDQARDLILANI